MTNRDSARITDLTNTLYSLRDAAKNVADMISQCERSLVLPPAATTPLRGLRQILSDELRRTEELLVDHEEADRESARESSLDDLIDAKIDGVHCMIRPGAVIP